MAEHGYRHLGQRFNLPKPNDQSNIPIQVEGTMEGTVGTVEAMMEAMMEAIKRLQWRL